MKHNNNKKGFTLVEIIVVIGLLIAITGIFTVNFISNMNSQKEREYKDKINTIEASADAYVMSHKDDTTLEYDDYRLVLENDETFTYITLDEITDDGFLQEEVTIDPQTGEEFTGVIKFTNDKGEYKYEYVPEPQDVITIIFHRNGADEVSRTAKAFFCKDKNNVQACVGNDDALPDIKRVGGTTYGWSTDPNKKTDTTFKAGTSLKTILSNSNYEVKNNRVYIYALSSEVLTAQYEDPSHTTTSMPGPSSCTVYNAEPSCEISLPDYRTDEFHSKQGWANNVSGTGQTYKIGDIFQLATNIILYPKNNIAPFDIKVNKLSRSSSRETQASNINLVLTLDTSGSMSGSRIKGLKEVTTLIADRINFTASTVSIVEFESSSKILLTLSNNKTEVKNIINKLSAGGCTNYKAAIENTAHVVNSVNNNKPSYVILVSDGYPTTSISLTDSTLTNLKKNATIYTIGVGSSVDRAYLRGIASKDTNYYQYDEYSDDSTMSGLYKIFDDIVQDIMILEGDGEDKAVSVTVIDGKLKIGQLVISDNNPVSVFLNGKEISKYTSENSYFYKENGVYYFDVYKYAKETPGVGATNMKNLRIKYFYKEDTKN